MGKTGRLFLLGLLGAGGVAALLVSRRWPGAEEAGPDSTHAREPLSEAFAASERIHLVLRGRLLVDFDLSTHGRFHVDAFPPERRRPFSWEAGLRWTERVASRWSTWSC